MRFSCKLSIKWIYINFWKLWFFIFSLEFFSEILYLRFRFESCKIFHVGRFFRIQNFRNLIFILVWNVDKKEFLAVRYISNYKQFIPKIKICIYILPLNSFVYTIVTEKSILWSHTRDYGRYKDMWQCARCSIKVALIV